MTRSIDFLLIQLWWKIIFLSCFEIQSIKSNTKCWKSSCKADFLECGYINAGYEHSDRANVNFLNANVLHKFHYSGSDNRKNVEVKKIAQKQVKFT